MPFSHPQIVHFPIALLLTAVLCDIISYFWQKDFFSNASLLLIFLGVIAAFVATDTGHEAAQQAVKNLTNIRPLIHEHEEAGEWVPKIFGLVLIGRVVLLYLKKNMLTVRIVLTIIMFFGAFKIYEAGKFGGELVFDHGAAVKPVIEQAK